MLPRGGGPPQRGDLTAALACQKTSQHQTSTVLPRTCVGNRATLPLPRSPSALSHIHSKTACRGFKSFCPCQKTGENTGFSPVCFFHVLHGYVVHFGSDFGFSYPFAPAAPPSSTRNAPGFALFGRFRVRFSLFPCFSGAKFSALFLCILLHSVYKLKPSVIPCKREVSFLT